MSFLAAAIVNDDDPRKKVCLLPLGGREIFFFAHFQTGTGHGVRRLLASFHML